MQNTTSPEQLAPNGSPIAPSPDAPTDPTRRLDWATAALFVLFCTVELLLILNHDSFRDEAQAWFWVLDFASWRDYFIIPYEGHPPLWYWILKLQSLFLGFDQARWLSLGVGIANAVLLWRLLPRQPVLYGLILFTQAVLIFWGFFYRPYGMMLSFTLAALVAHKAGRTVLGTWILAFACGLHFFAGFIFAFWLAVLIGRRQPVRPLIGPALLALGFGVLAVLSSLGNPRGGLEFDNAILGTLRVFTLPFKLSSEPWPIWFVLMGAMVGIAFWRDKLVLAALVLATTAFCLFGQFVYQLTEWHYGLLTVLILMAFFLAGSRARIWPLMVLMLPQTANGLISAGSLLFTPYSSALGAYEAVAVDAGPRLDPQRNLLGWPDFTLTAPAALRDFRYISGNTGALLGPTLYGAERPDDYWPNPGILVRADLPYWLVCMYCEKPVQAVRDAGLTAVEVLPPTPGNNAEAIGAYRIDRE